MVRRLHFIAGLPRSGSTLLCALLRQNPRFATAVTSPVASLCNGLLQQMSGGTEFAVFFNDNRRRAVLRGMFHGYYNDIPDDHVVFDTNRTWTSKISLLRDLFPGARIICCVREVGWIIDSIERMLQRNPLQPSRIFNFKSGNTVYARADALMNQQKGLIGIAWTSLRQAWFNENARQLLLVNYDSLVQQPQTTVQALYEELGESPFQHDFNHLTFDAPDYDASLGMPGLHRVRTKIEYDRRENCVPPDILAKYAAANFWLKPESNHRRVRIL